jgi:hypothetical protein
MRNAARLRTDGRTREHFGSRSWPHHGRLRSVGRGAAVVGVAGGLLLVGWSAHDTLASTNGDWAAAVGNAASWGGDAGKFALGALIGAIGGGLVSRANRAEAREGRFADRIRELAAQIIYTGFKFRAAVGDQLQMRQEEPEKALPQIDFNNWEFLQALRELELIVRRPESSVALSRFHLAVMDFKRFDKSKSETKGPPDDNDWQEWARVWTTWERALVRLEDAIRVELGVCPVDRARVEAVLSEWVLEEAREDAPDASSGDQA